MTNIRKSTLAPVEEPKDRVLRQIAAWRQDLINLTRSNRLLYYRPTKTSSLEVLEPSLQQVTARLLNPNLGGWKFFVPSPEEEDSEDSSKEEIRRRSEDEILTSKEDSEALSRCLASLDRRTTQEYLDKGLWILYVAAGMLDWLDPIDNSKIASPLILIPVALHRESVRDPFELVRADEDIVINPSLTAKLDAEFGVTLPSLDELDESRPESFLRKVANTVADRGWSVSHEVVLSTFSFYKEVIYRDLKENEERLANHSLIDLISQESVEASPFQFDPINPDVLDEQAPPEKAVTILDADSSQRQCIAAARDGHSYIMDGPPGTGKSQTIANIIAELLTAGKTVLFVSEKAAALDVVQKRLREVGIADFALALHSHKTRRSEVAQELGRALTMQPKVPTRIAHADLARLREYREELSQYAMAMNEIRSPLEKSLHAVLARLCELEQIAEAPLPQSVGVDISPQYVARMLSLGERLARNWGPIACQDEFIWKGYKGPRFDAGARRHVSQCLENATQALDQVKNLVRAIAMDVRVVPGGSLNELPRLLEIVRLLSTAHPIPVHWLSTNRFAEVTALSDLLSSATKDYHRAVNELQETFGAMWRELPESGFQKLSDSMKSLQGLSPSFVLEPTSTAQTIQSTLGSLGEATSLLGRVEDGARFICQAFAIPEDGISIKRAEELFELASLTANVERPEPEWFHPVVLETVRQGAQVLKEHLLNYRKLSAQLSSVFTAEVLTLDLKAMSARFAHTHKGVFKWFRSSYWNDRKALRSVAVRGKVDVTLLEELPAALVWQNADLALSEAEERYRKVLGRHYSDRKTTDFDHIERALELVGRAVELARIPIPDSVVREQLSLDGQPNPAIANTSRDLAQQLRDWKQSKSFVNEIYPNASIAELFEFIDWANQVIGHLNAIHEVVTALDRLANGELGLKEVGTLLGDSVTVQGVESLLDERSQEGSELLGSRFRGLNTNWKELQGDLEWSTNLRTIVGAPIEYEDAESMLSLSSDPAELEHRVKNWTDAKDAVLGLFDDSSAGFLDKELGTTFSDALDVLAALQTRQEQIAEWLEYRHAGQELTEAGLGEVFDFCIAEGCSGEDVPRIIEKAILDRWVDVVLEEDDGRLHNARAEERDLHVSAFRELDHKLVTRCAARVIESCNARRPKTGLGMAGIIQHQAQLKRKHMPVRDLLNRTWDVVQALKPCFMMSPLTVSQFLPARECFDVVIFDEASQVRPCDSVNAIYRGKQLIIAGDQKQLPPSAFFDVVIDDGSDVYEEGAIAEFESILDLCKGCGALRSLPLLWHYRSRHEDLITFSNYRFYKGQLITFPSSTDESDWLGVEFVHVADGVYRRGGARDNPREAEFVIERILQHVRCRPDQSLGIVAFSAAQADAIEAKLEVARRAHPEVDTFFAEDRLDGFFVKNLENVQGDERDTIILSVGYGKDEAGKFTLQMGPLSQKSGHRRLNVAITRARKRVEVVSSVCHSDFVGQMTHEGVRHLRSYLLYAERGPEALAIEVHETGRDVESPFEDEVARVVRSWGYDVVPQVGSAGYRIDLAVRNPAKEGEFILGIECDGTMYHSTKVARDRDRLRQDVLEGLGWTLHRIWGIAWYRERATQEDRLRKAIESAAAEKNSVRASLSAPAREEASVDYEFPDLDSTPDWIAPYKIASIRLPNGKGDIQAVESRGLVRRAVEEVGRTEAPIAKEVLIQRVREAWGYGRTGANIREAIEGELKTLLSREVLSVDRAGFVWCGEAIRNVRSPQTGRPETRRTVSEVPVEELRLAITCLVGDAMAITDEELITKVSRIFGWARTGHDIAQELSRSVKWLIREGTLLRDGEFLRAKR